MKGLPLKATGSAGSWFATVGGERFACVNDSMCSWKERRRYHDPYVRPGFRQSDIMVAAIRARRKVILTHVKVTTRQDGWEDAKRLGYIAIWTVNDIKFDETGLRFEFEERLEELI